MHPKSTLLFPLLPLVQLSVGQPLLDVSKVFYFNQLPDNVTSDFPPEFEDAKNQLYIRKDVDELHESSISCNPNGTIQLGFEDVSALELDGVGYGMIGHPIIVPHNYTKAEGCPDIQSHTFFGPKQDIPEDVLAELSDDADYAIFITMSVDALKDNQLTISANWADYHSIMGSIGDAPEGLEWFNIGVYPWTNVSGSSNKVKRVDGKNRAAITNAVTSFALEKIWGLFTGS